MQTKNGKKGKRSRRYNKRKKTVKGSYISRGVGIHPTTSSPLPQTFKTVLRYNEIAKLQASGTSTDRYVLGANNCYDPDFSYGGHQPRGFDQLMAMYNKWVVVGSKITINFNNTTAYPGIVGVVERVDSTAQTYLNYIEGANRVIWKQLGPSSGPNSSWTMTEKHSPKKFFGKSKIMDNENLKGNAAAGPSLPVYWHIFYYDMANSINTAAIYFTYQIEYIVVFHEPITVPAS